MKRESLVLCILCSLFFAFSFPAPAQVSFLQPALYSGGGNAFVADFNGDGKLDILTSDGTMNLGNGDGTFKAGTPVSVSSGPVLAVADFNGDGKPDVLEQGAGTLIVLLGNGDGTFQAPISTPSGAALSAVGAVDLKGNGKSDVVGVFNSSLVVYLSNGDGTFASGVSYSLGVLGSGALLSFGDFNSDTKIDVAVSIPGATGAGFEVVFLGNGDGTLQAEKTSTGIYDPQYAAVGDFNGDGSPDLAIDGCNISYCSSPSAGGVYILFGKGDGTFQAPSPAFSGIGPIAAGDVNGDHKLDLLLVSNNDPGTIQIYLGNGDGSFSGPNNYGITVGSITSAIALADFNGDGYLDIAAGGVMLGNGDGTFRGIQLGVAPGSYPTAAALGDFEKKGAFDVAMLSYQGGNLANSLYILSNNGSGGLSLIHSYLLPLVGTGVATADFNADGNLDLLVVGTDPTTQDLGYSVLLGNGDGSFQSPVYYPQGVPGSLSFVIADFNNDHKPDLAVAFGISSSIASESVGIFLGNGDGTFASPVYFYDAGAANLLVADFNGDGKLDIAAGGANPSPPNNLETAILFGNGDGTFQAALFPANLNGFMAAFTADVNNDGRPDLVSGNQVALGNGDGTFTLLPALAAGDYSYFVISAIADFNGDGKLDVLGQEGNDHAEQSDILLGNGDGTFGSSINVTTSGVIAQSPVLVADMNGDSQPDIVFPWENVMGLCAPGFCVGSPTGVGVLINTTQTVSPQPDFRVFASGLSPTPVTAGNSATSTITIAPLNGFTSAVALACTGLPTGITCAFNPASITGGSGTSTLTVTAASSLAAGSYTVVATGVSGSISHIAAVTLTVESGTTPDFQISATAASPATVAPGGSATSTVTVAALDGFNSAVALTCSSAGGLTCSLNPSSVTPSGSTSPASTLMLTTTAATPSGLYPIVIAGTSRGNEHSTTVTLTVQPTTPGFTLGGSSGSPTSQTITAGQTASFSLALAPTGSFTGAVNLSCAITPAVTPAPTCTLSSSSVQISGSGTQTVTVKVATTPGATGTASRFSFPPGAIPLTWSLLLLGSAWLWKRNRPCLRLLAASTVVLGFVFLLGCGGSGSSSSSQTGTPAGTYTATITATAGSVSHNIALQVIVQ